MIFGVDLFGLLIGFVTTLVVAIIIVLTARWHGRWTHDIPVGVQKFHEHLTPRIGGLALVLGVIVSMSLSKDEVLLDVFRPIVICGLIPFIFGFREDLTKRVSVGDRLLSAALAAGAMVWLTGVYLTHVHVPILDHLLSWYPFALVFTIVAITGLTNAINILDGFNGLASGVSVLILLFIAWLAYQVGDADLAEMALIMMFCVLGFMALNYPFGKVFLGDSGAYFVGFMIGSLAILLPMRNPGVSPWASLLICAYPVWEAIFSMYRRWRARMASTQPDHLHLHSLFKTRLVLRYVHQWPAWMRNSLVAPWIWLSTVLLGTATLFFWQSTGMLQLIFALFVAWYILTYRALSRLPDYREMVKQQDGIGN